MSDDFTTDLLKEEEYLDDLRQQLFDINENIEKVKGTANSMSVLTEIEKAQEQLKEIFHLLGMTKIDTEEEIIRRLQVD